MEVLSKRILRKLLPGSNASRQDPQYATAAYLMTT